MIVGRRPPQPIALITLVAALTGVAAWLGVIESPHAPAETAWQGFLSSTEAAGTLVFSSVTTTSGEAGGVERTTGVVDFSTRDAAEVSVVRGPQSPDQWSEVVVVGGSAYERPGSDVAGGRRFRGEWTRLSSFAVVPFDPLTGPSPDAAPVGGPSLQRVGTMSLGGVATTEFRLSPVTITCVAGDGDQRSENVSSTVWVDSDGRIVQFENLTAVAVAGVQSAVLTVSRFGRLGVPVAVDLPLAVAPAPTARNRAPDPLAGCLLTPS